MRSVDNVLQLYHRPHWQLWLVREQPDVLSGHRQRPNHWQLRLMGLAEQRVSPMRPNGHPCSFLCCRQAIVERYACGVIG